MIRLQRATSYLYQLTQNGKLITYLCAGEVLNCLPVGLKVDRSGVVLSFTSGALRQAPNTHYMTQLTLRIYDEELWAGTGTPGGRKRLGQVEYIQQHPTHWVNQILNEAQILLTDIEHRAMSIRVWYRS